MEEDRPQNQRDSDEDFEYDSDEQPAFLGEDDIDEMIEIEDGIPPEEDSDDEDMEQEEILDESVKQFVSHTAFSPSAPTLFASGGGDDIGIIWDADTGEQKFKLDGHTDTVTKVAFSNNGELLATCGMDATVKVWDPATGKLLQTLEGPGESLDCCAWHPRGPVLLAGSGDGTAWMWHGKTGAMMNVFAGHSDAVVACVFTSDGSKVVTSSADMTIRVWDPKTAQVLHTIRDGGALPFHEAPITVMKTHPEKDGIVTGSGEGIISVSNATSGKVLSVYREHTDSIEDLLFLSFLPCVASASLDSSVNIWDINTLQTRTKLQLSAGVVRLISCPDVPHVIIAGCLDGTINVCDARAGKIIKILTGHTEEILDLTISGKMVLSASEDKTVRLWDIAPFLTEAK